MRCPCAFSTACMQMISLHFFKAARFWNLDSNHMAGGLETPGLHVRGWGTRLPWRAVRPTAGLLLGIAADLPCWQLVLQAPGWDLPLALHRFRQVGKREGTTGDSWATWSCCDHSWCQQPGTQAALPPLLFSERRKQRLQLPQIHDSWLLGQFAPSVTKSFFSPHSDLKFNYSCASMENKMVPSHVFPEDNSMHSHRHTFKTHQRASKCGKRGTSSE